jgi:hypothetical protein
VSKAILPRTAASLPASCAAGGLELTAAWPTAVPAGIQLLLPCAVLDSVGPQDAALGNATPEVVP